MLSPTLAEIPIIGGLFILDLREQRDSLVPIVCAALVARERFRQDGPVWAAELPLYGPLQTEMIEDDNPRLKLVGYYGSSLWSADYNYDRHPRIPAFASGMMAYEHAPDVIRNDPQLQQEYPPCQLEGLCDGILYWRDADLIALYRRALAGPRAAHPRS
jgi:hypothetical protein